MDKKIHDEFAISTVVKAVDASLAAAVIILVNAN